jgi:hypothetical protein
LPPSCRDFDHCAPGPSSEQFTDYRPCAFILPLPRMMPPIAAERLLDFSRYHEYYQMTFIAAMLA